MKEPFQVIYEDNHLLVVNKASGILVQGDITGDVPLVELCKQYIGKKYQKPGSVFLGVVHRIDRPVSGIVVLARTSKALERMNALFREKRTRKTYWAITESRPPTPSGELVHWISKDERKNRATAYPKEMPGALRSELTYEVIGQRSNRWLLSVAPLTGRPHQIRVQLASMGCPIVGDVKYGFARALEDGSIGLHSRRLAFVHPVKREPMVLEAPVPDTSWWTPFADIKEKETK